MGESHAAAERPELFHQIATSGFDVVEKPLSVWTKLSGNGAARVLFDPGRVIGLLHLARERDSRRRSRYGVPSGNRVITSTAATGRISS